MPKMKGRTLGKTTVLKLTDKQAEEARDFGTIKKTTGGYVFLQAGALIHPHGTVH